MLLGKFLKRKTITIFDCSAFSSRVELYCDDVNSCRKNFVVSEQLRSRPADNALNRCAVIKHPFFLPSPKSADSGIFLNSKLYAYFLESQELQNTAGRPSSNFQSRDIAWYFKSSKFTTPSVVIARIRCATVIFSK